MLNKTVDYLRFTLYGLLLVIILLLYQRWDIEHPTKPSSFSTNVTQSLSPPHYVPDVVETSKITSESKPTLLKSSASLIQVKTDVLDVSIDPVGGNINEIKLLKFPEKLHSSAPFLLLNNNDATRYIAQSGLLSPIGPDTKEGQATYVSQKSNYVLLDNKKTLQVTLTWKNATGIIINKIFTFKPNEYEINVDYQIQNHSKEPWEGNLYLQLMRKNTPPSNGSSGLANFSTYFGAAMWSPDKHFEKVSFKDIQNQTLNRTIEGGWSAMVQHYFVSAWIPDQNTVSQYFTRATSDGLYIIGSLGPKLTVSPGETRITHAKFFAGPAIADLLNKTAPGLGLDLTIDYGWFWFISVIIFWMMQKIYELVGNWGWSIVLVTVIIKLLFYHLSAKSYRSMSAMKQIQPKINALKEKYGEDKQQFTQATLELYKKEKVNPMSGCLPILIQIPVFIALYWVLVESVYLRQAPFILWIQDLSTKDPYYVLPILMGLSMLLQQRLSPPPADPMQAKVMMMMPIIFTVLFINFPAGLMLYWFINNTLSVLQQWFIMRRMEKSEKK